MVEELFAEGVRVDYISRLISEINDKVISKTAYFIQRDIKEKAPVNFAIMVLGSEGRREQTLKTDQDNALIYDEDNTKREDRIYKYFKLFGEAFTETLINIGFPPCPGNVMINNEEWRLSKSVWHKKIIEWLTKPDPEHTLRVGMFFDFRKAYGHEKLVESLRELVFKNINGKILFTIKED